MREFIGVPLVTGYLTYLRYYFDRYLHEYVIDQFEVHNPECNDPFEVASSPGFYLDVVTSEEEGLSEQVIPVTIENFTASLDSLCHQIKRIEAAIYPLRRFLILNGFLETQVHIESESTIDEITEFLKRRLKEQKLFFAPGIDLY